jgi:hypothetical protein
VEATTSHLALRFGYLRATSERQHYAPSIHRSRIAVSFAQIGSEQSYQQAARYFGTIAAAEQSLASRSFTCFASSLCSFSFGKHAVSAVCFSSHPAVQSTLHFS